MGRPPKYKKDFHPDDFIRQSKSGKTITQIAANWDINRDTIYAWSGKHKEFSDALKKGKEFSEAWYIDLGQSAMVGQAKVNGEKISLNVGMYCWLTKNLFKWSDQITQDVTTESVVNLKANLSIKRENN